MSRGAVVYLLFVLALTLWCSLIISAPFLYSGGHRAASELDYYFFSFACHQLPERSFFMFDYKLAVCARCTGIYVGMLASALLFPFVRGVGSKKPPSRWILLLSMVPIAVDGTTQLFGLGESTNAVRFFTGFLFGFALTLYVLPVVFELSDIILNRMDENR